MSIDWNHLRCILAIERHGSVRAAGRELGVNHATISRQVAALSGRLGVRIFERRGRRLALTEEGAELVEVARAVEERIVGVERRLSGRDRQLQGHVRVSMTESVARLVAPRLHEFAAAYPAITVDLSTGLSFKNLAQMEADVVVRVVNEPPEQLVGRRIGDFLMDACGATTLIDSTPAETPADYPWVAWTSHLGKDFPMEVWLRRAVPAAQIRFTADSEFMMHRLIVSGLGAGVMPRMLIAADERVRRLDARLGCPTFHNTLWVLRHEDVRHTKRISATTEWLSAILSEMIARVAD